MNVEIRPMAFDDIEQVGEVVSAANKAAAPSWGEEYTPPTDEQREQFARGTRRFIEQDGQGAWVADADGRVVGMAESIRRNGFWGLAMLFIHPDWQSQGVGRQLIGCALEYAEGADVRMIMTSPDPRALRRYALAGLRIHPAVQASGTVERAAIPATLRGREGTHEDLDLVGDVDVSILGRSRRDDVAFAALGGAGSLDVIDDADGRGFVVTRNGHVTMLGATDEETATDLLWRSLARSGDKTSVYCLTAEQDWAVRVCLAARLKVVGAGPLFLSGMDRPPGPWIPSGWYF